MFFNSSWIEVAELERGSNLIHRRCFEVEAKGVSRANNLILTALVIVTSAREEVQTISLIPYRIGNCSNVWNVS